MVRVAPLRVTAPALPSARVRPAGTLTPAALIDPPVQLIAGVVFRFKVAGPLKVAPESVSWPPPVKSVAALKVWAPLA